jgi:uncharacterized membrane protein
MSIAPEHPPALLRPKPHRPFRAAVLRGLGGFIPPLMTVVVILWVFGTVEQYVLSPFRLGTTKLIAMSLQQYAIYPESISEDGQTVTVGGQERRVASNNAVIVDRGLYYKLSGGNLVPANIYQTVYQHDGSVGATVSSALERYAELSYMKWYYVLPAFLAIFTLFLYFLGKLLAGRLGQFVWENSERVIRRVPLVRNVYSSVKQVTEFFLNQHELEFTRVVAIEYPRKDCWAVAFVTGESLMDVADAAGEPALSVLVPTSPMPITGFTCIVLKREVVDLNITIDQALEYIISCGVVVPPHQLQLAMRQKNEKERGRRTNAHRPALAGDGQASVPAAAAERPAASP